MQYLLLMIVIALISAQHVLQKQYPRTSTNPNVFLFGAVSAVAAMLFFAVSSGFQLHFASEFLPYSIAFGVAYGSAMVGNVMALKLGSLALTSLITSYSLLIPTLYGVIVLKDSIGVTGYVGIFLLVCSIFLLNAKREKTVITGKWLIAVVIAFLGNGGCTVFQKMEQMRFEGGYKSEFMIVALAIVAAFLFGVGLFQKGELKKETAAALKTAVPNGVANGIVNLLVMVLTGAIPSAILFPSISAGGIVLSWILATFLYKEKLSRVQLAGYFIGVVSVILLNL